MKKRSGFTLIEMMITVGIIGILASVAMPAFSRYKDNVLDAEATTMMHAIHTALATFYTSEWVGQGETSGTASQCMFAAGVAGSELLQLPPGSKSYLDFGASNEFNAIGMSDASGYYSHTFVFMAGGSGCLDGRGDNGLVAATIALRVLPGPRLRIFSVPEVARNGELTWGNGIFARTYEMEELASVLGPDDQDGGALRGLLLAYGTPISH